MAEEKTWITYKKTGQSMIALLSGLIQFRAVFAACSCSHHPAG